VKYYKENEIRRETPIPYNPKQNGASKRKTRTIFECERSLLKGKKLPNNLWVEAVNIAMYLQNRIPTKYLLFGVSYEYFFGYKLIVGHLKVFGCIVCAHIPKENMGNGMQN
jgi:hypothetical protein